MTLSNPAQYISGRTVQEQMNSLIDYVDQRAGDVALDAIASDVAQVHQDMLDADADAAAAAASAAAAAGTLANAVKKTGEASQSIAGDIAVAGALSGGSISASGAATFSGTTTVPAPVNNTDAATKKYVDDSLASYAPMVRTTDAQTIAGNKTFVDTIISNHNRINRLNAKATAAGEYIVLQIPGTENTHRFVIDYASRSTGIGKFQIDTNLSAATLTVTTVYNTAVNPPVFNLYTDANNNQYVGITAVANDVIEISGGTFHMRTTSVGAQIVFMDSFTSPSGYTKITNN